MATNIYINGSHQPNFEFGFGIKKKYTKDLDTGTLSINQVEKMTIEPGDEVTIYEDTTVYRMLVAEYTAVSTKFQGTKLFNYNISLISPTIQLQGIVMPNRAITNRFNGTDKTIYEIAEQYREIYAPDFNFSSTFQNETNSVVADENSWNRPTFFEVLNDLLAKINCVVTMIDFDTISIIKLDEFGSEIDEDKINTIEYNRNIDEYASEIEVEASGVHSRLPNTSSGWNTTRTEESMLTTDNGQIILSKPIQHLHKIEVSVLLWIDYTGVQGDSYWRAYNPIDITEYCLPKKVYDALKISDATNPTPKNEYKRFHISWEEGSNVIDNLFYFDNLWFLNAQDNPAIQNIIEDWMEDDQATYPYYSLLEAQLKGDWDHCLKRLAFNVVYSTAEDVKFKSRPAVAPKNKRTIINNQTTSLVDVTLLGKQQQDVVEKTGEEIMTIKGRVDRTHLIPDLGDTYNDFVGFELDIVHMNGFYDYKMRMMKDYIMENMYANVERKRRYTSLIPASEAVKSNHLTEQVWRLQKTAQVYDAELLNLIKKFSSIFGGSNQEWYHYALCRTYKTDGTILADLMLPLSVYAVGKSIVSSYKMEDNYSAGLRVDPEHTILTDKRKMKYVSYVDDDGEFMDIRTRYISEDEINCFYDVANYNGDEDKARDLLEAMNKLPTVTSIASIEGVLSYQWGLEITGRVPRHKDNRETTIETCQMHLFGSDDVFIGARFYDTYNLVSWGGIEDYRDVPDNPYNYKIAYSTNLLYNKNDKVGKGTIVSYSTGARFYVWSSEGYLALWTPNTSTFIDTLPETVISWAILDENNEIIFAVNGPKTQKLYWEREE